MARRGFAGRRALPATGRVGDFSHRARDGDWHRPARVDARARHRGRRRAATRLAATGAHAAVLFNGGIGTLPAARRRLAADVRGALARRIPVLLTCFNARESVGGASCSPTGSRPFRSAPGGRTTARSRAPRAAAAAAAAGASPPVLVGVRQRARRRRAQAEALPRAQFVRACVKRSRRRTCSRLELLRGARDDEHARARVLIAGPRPTAARAALAAAGARSRQARRRATRAAAAARPPEEAVAARATRGRKSGRRDDSALRRADRVREITRAPRAKRAARRRARARSRARAASASPSSPLCTCGARRSRRARRARAPRARRSARTRLGRGCVSESERRRVLPTPRTTRPSGAEESAAN